jgi:hypothetical protein
MKSTKTLQAATTVVVSFALAGSGSNSPLPLQYIAATPNTVAKQILP